TVLCDIDKGSFAGVLEYAVLTHASDQDVGIAVIVVVAGRHTHSIHFNIKAGSTGYVGKSSVTIVAIKLERAALALVAGPIRSVDEKNVLPSVGVVIQKCTAWTECFRKKLSALSATIVAELNAGRTSHIDEPKSGSGGRSQQSFRRDLQSSGKGSEPTQKRPAIHGRFTSPLRMAYVTSSAVL